MKNLWVYAIRDVDNIVYPYKMAAYTSCTLNRYAYTCATEAKAIKELYMEISKLPIRNGKKKIKKKLIELEEKYMNTFPEVFI